MLVTLTLGSLLRTLPPTLSKIAIDDGVLADNLGVLFVTIGLFVGAVVLSNVAMAGRLYAARYSAQKVIHDIRNDLYTHLSAKSMSFFDRHQTGDLMSRVTNDVNMIQFFFTMAGTVILSSIALTAMNLVFMFALDWVLALAILGLVPFFVAMQSVAKRVVPLFRQSNQQMGVVNVEIREAISGIKVIQAFGREQYQEERFDKENWKLRDLRTRVLRTFALYSQGIELIAGAATALILGLGAWRIVNGDFTLGGLVAFQGYLLLMLAPTRFLGFAVQITQQAVTSGERVFQIIDTPLDVQEKPDAYPLPEVRGEIEFDRVTFQYGDRDPILRDVSVHVPAGGSLAIVGRSGSGKSTLANLLPRFYDPTEGAIRVDGHDLRDIRLQDLRSGIGMVMQETFLFNMTVADNLRFGRKNASREDLEAAARMAAAHDFISELPNGYDTLIGDRGVRLSGGQRQRVAIARALLVRPAILVLDEATSSVDTRTDRAIQRALEQLMQERTTIVIAHRLSTIRRVDQIIVVDGGRIVARGTHEELLETSDDYRAIYELQFRLQEESLAIEAGGEVSV
ncbi:MAG: ABC transporter ATP-binding protein [Chloroflexota bacterium]|nr:ABC transporter ATP-binding protein [Chloroflexota bacterium]